jgi:hypothetical protein
MLDPTQNQNNQSQPLINGTLPQSDVPPMPDYSSTGNSNSTSQSPVQPMVSNTQPPNASDFFPPIISTPPKKKFGSGKIIATFLGILLLVGGITAGIVLTRQPQLIEQKASDSANCNVSFDLPDTAICWMDPISSVPISYTVHSLPETGGPFYMETNWYVAAPSPGPNHYDVSQQIVAGGKYTVYASWPGVTDKTKTTEIHAGLQVRDSTGNMLNPNCTGGMDYYWTPYVACSPTPTPSQSPSPSPTPVGSPTPTAYPTAPGSPTVSCSGVKAYNTSWVELSAAQLANLKPGNTVNYCVGGTASSGSFDMAKFTINNVSQNETTNKRPTSNDYCQTYVLPAGTNTFTITAQIHHVTLGWVGQ